MKKNDDVNIPFLPLPFEFGDRINRKDCFDPLGSYTGKMPEHGEIPVQDADDL